VAEVVRPAGLRGLRADEGDALVACSSGAVDRRVTERRGRTRGSFEPHGELGRPQEDPPLPLSKSPSKPLPLLDTRQKCALSERR
jgi:hypothetical protein